MTAISLITRSEFVSDVASALETGSGFAAGKIGFGEQRLLYFPIFLESAPNPAQIRAYQTMLKFDCERQMGIFPSDAAFVERFVTWYGQQVGKLDCLGLFRSPPREQIIVQHYGLQAKLIYYGDMQPDRSLPSREDQCYLNHFEGRGLLLVAPFAELLRARAKSDIFEAVWSNGGKRWHPPRSVSAIEFPYGYADVNHGPFATCLELFDDITARMDRIEFDVALIAAGSLGIPLAAHAKRTGRVGISLGGHLQVLFGVSGKRWREDEAWRRKHINEHWIDMPERYHPRAKEQLTDGGAYW